MFTSNLISQTIWLKVKLKLVNLKNLVTLKVLIWSRGRLVTLQILTSLSISLVEVIHSPSGQSVSFSLIDVLQVGTTSREWFHYLRSLLFFL